VLDVTNEQLAPGWRLRTADATVPSRVHEESSMHRMMRTIMDLDLRADAVWF